MATGSQPIGPDILCKEIAEIQEIIRQQIPFPTYMPADAGMTDVQIIRAQTDELFKARAEAGRQMEPGASKSCLLACMYYLLPNLHEREERAVAAFRELYNRLALFGRFLFHKSALSGETRYLYAASVELPELDRTFALDRCRREFKGRIIITMFPLIPTTSLPTVFGKHEMSWPLGEFVVFWHDARASVLNDLERIKSKLQQGHSAVDARAPATPEAAASSPSITPPAATGQPAKQAPGMPGDTVPEILKGTHRICQAIKQPKDAWRSIKALNAKAGGPIRFRGNRPWANRAELVEWWTRMHEKAEAASEKSQAQIDREATGAPIVEKLRHDPKHAQLAAEDVDLGLDNRRTHLRRERREPKP